MSSQTSADERDEAKPQPVQATAGPPPGPPPPPPAYPTGVTLAVTLFALFISLFCVALDSTIIATAIPRITDQFHALQHVGWYGSSYLLTKCGMSYIITSDGCGVLGSLTTWPPAFQLPFGKAFRFFSLKWTFLAALFIFEVGSVLCGAAQNSAMLIVGVSSVHQRPALDHHVRRRMVC